MKKSVNRISHEKQNPIDGILAEALTVAGGRIEASDHLKWQIDRRILQADRRKERQVQDMDRKRYGIKKTVIGVAAACLAVGSVCLAAAGFGGYNSSSSAIPDYRSFEDMDKAEKKVGYKFDAVEGFANGFTLKGIHIGDISKENPDGTTAGSQKNVHIQYEKGEEKIIFEARKLFEGETEENLYSYTPDKTLQCGDVTVRFSQNTYKLVPPDYQPTPEEEKQEQAGTLMIGYGSDELEVQEFYYTGWVKDGIVYVISGFDLSVGGDELLSMAKEIIENGN